MKRLLFASLCCALFTLLSAQTPQISWWYDLDDSAFGNAAAADIDGDQKLEITFGCYRNDGMIYALNAEDGSLLWQFDASPGFAEGCNDVATLIYDVDQDGELEVVVPSSCNPKTFCFNGTDGSIEWVTDLHGSDSPPSISDIDNDGKPEILHGNFGGSVSCLNGEDGSIAWDLDVDNNSWIQTAPAILDVDLDGQLDFVVANYSFGEDHRIFCYRADNQELLWSSDLPNDVMYHGASFADLDQDGYQELVIGSYDGSVYTLNAEDGSEAWSFSFPSSWYVPSPTSIADLNNDQRLEVVFFDGDHLGVLSHDGQLLWDYTIPSLGQTFRGAAISDINNDQVLDVVFGSSNGTLYALSGDDGDEIWTVDLADHYGDVRFDIDHGPLIADFDGDGLLDVFVVGGYTTFPEFENNFGRAYLISTESTGGPEWLMFRRDSVRSGAIELDINTATATIPGREDALNIFPNPGSEHFQFTPPADGQIYSISVFNTAGQLIRELPPSSTVFDLRGEPAGAYMLQINAEAYNSKEVFFKVN